MVKQKAAQGNGLVQHLQSGNAGRRESASALQWAEPLRYLIVKLNSDRNRPHRASLADALLVLRY